MSSTTSTLTSEGRAHTTSSSLSSVSSRVSFPPSESKAFTSGSGDGQGDDFPASLKGRRILLATETLGPVNGVNRTTLTLINYLRDHGVQVAAVAPSFKGNKRGLNAGVDTDFRLQGQPLPYNPDMTIVYPFRIDRICRRTFGQFKPDVIYLASPASVGFQFLLQSRMLKVPPVVLCNFQTDLAAYGEIIFPRLMGNYAVWLLGVVQGYLFSHPAVSTVFYPCSDIRYYLEAIGTPSSKLVQLGRGVDTELFNPSRRDNTYRREVAPNGEKIIVCVCRLAPEKGFDFLAQVARQLANASTPFKLLIVGGNRNASVEDKVRQMFDPVKEHVVFTGFLVGVDLARAYAAGDIFLHCSITETFGLVVLEAMASGMPVIARDKGGPSEIVRHSQTGYLVPPDNVEEFTSHVQRMIEDDVLCSQLAIGARQVAEDTTWDKISSRVAHHIAIGLERHEREARQKAVQRQSHGFLRSLLSTARSRLISPLTLRLRLYACMLLVLAFWFIAVLPLIVHGNVIFRATQGRTVATI